jgi:hypothetical protein
VQPEAVVFYSFLTLSYAVRAYAVVAALALTLGRYPGRDRVRLLAAAALVLCLAEIILLFPFIGYDYSVFWRVGDHVWHGLDPYAPEHFPILYPPNALPFFAVLALLPYNVSFGLWTALNALALLGLVVLAQRALQPPEHGGSPFPSTREAAWKLPPQGVVVLTAVLALSEAARATFYTGHLGILTAALVLLALHAQGRGRPALAGLWLGLAAIKPMTVLPFLLLFHRKADVKSWLVMGAVILALCLATGSPARLVERVSVLRNQAEKLGGPGEVNDYSFDGPRTETIVSFDHALYRVGLRDRTIIRAGQYLIVLALGGWVAYQCLGRRALPRAAACSLVTLYAAVFLYHRTYDLVYLILPLVYSVGQARAQTGRSRQAFVASAVCILLTLYLRIDWFVELQKASLAWGAWGRLVQAVVLPYACWLILLAMAFLVIGVRRCGEEPAVEATHPVGALAPMK